MADEYVPIPDAQEPAPVIAGQSNTPPKQVASAVYTPVPDKQDSATTTYSDAVASTADAVTMAAHIGDVYTRSKDDIARSLANYEVAAGRKTWDQVEQDFTPGRTQTLRQQRITQFEASVSPDVVHKFGSSAIDFFTAAVPPIEDAVETGLAYGTAGAIAGITGGAVLAPETAGASMLAGAKVGFSSGFDAGVTKSATMSMVGHLYGEMRNNGVPHDTAVRHALYGGVLEALIFRARLNNLGENGIKNLQFALQAQPSKAAFLAFTARLTRDMGVAPAALGAAQGFVDVGTQWLASMVSGGKLPTMEDFSKTVTSTALQNIAFNAPVHGAALGVGTMGNIVNRFKGAPLKPGTTVEQTAATQLAKVRTLEATDASTVHKYLIGRIQDIGDRGEDIPQALFDQLIDAQEKLKAADAKAVKAKLDAATQHEYDALPVEERLAKAQDDQHQASNHLEVVRYAIELAENEGHEPTDSMIADRKDANIRMREASERVRKAKLEIERDKIQEKMNKPGTGEEAKLKAHAEFDRVNEDLRKIKETGILRTLTAKIDELKLKLHDLHDRVEADHRLEAEKRLGLGHRSDLDADARGQIAQAMAEKEPTPSKTLKAKIERVESQLKSAEYLYDFTHTESLPSSTLESLNGDVPVQKLKGIAEKFKRGLLKATRDTEHDTRMTLAEANRSANKLVRLSGVSKAAQKEFKGFKQEPKKTIGESLKGYADYVEEKTKAILDKEANEAATEHLEAALEETTPRDLTKRAQAAPHVQAWLKLYNELLQPGGREKAKQILENATNITDGDLVAPTEPGAINPAARLSIAAEVFNATTPELKHELAEHIIDLVDTGKDATLDMLRIRAAKQAVIIKTIMDALPPAAKAFAQQSLIVKQFKVGVDVWQYTWDAFRDTALMFEKDKYSKAFHMLDIHSAVDGARADTTTWMNKLHKALITENGKVSPRLAAQLVRNARSKFRAHLPEKLQNVNDDTLIQLMAYNEDPRLQNRIREGNKLSQEDINTVWNELNADQRGMVTKLKEFYQEAYNEVNAHHKKIFGYALKNNPDYAGPAYGTFEESTRNDFMEELFSNRSVLPGFVRDQTNNSNPIQLHGALENAEAYVGHAMQWKNWTEEKNGLPSAWDRLNTIMNNGDIKDRLVNKFGELYYRKMKEAFEDMSGIKPIRNDEIALISDAATSSAAIVANIAQMWKQPAGILNYAAVMNPFAFGHGVWEIATNLDKYYPMFKEMDFLKAREKSHFSELEARIRDARKNVNPALSVANRGLRIIQDLQGAALHITDLGNTVLGGGALLLHAKDAGFSDHEAAMLMANISDTTQGSTAIDQRTPLERQGTLGGIVSQFTKPNVQADILSTMATKKFFAAPTWDNAIKMFQANAAVRASEVTFAAASATTGLLGAALVGDVDDMNEKLKRLDAQMSTAAAFGAASGTPLLHKQIISAMVQYAIKDQLHSKVNTLEAPNAPLLSSVDQFLRWGVNVYQTQVTHNKLVTPEVESEMWREFNKSVVLWGLKVQVEEIHKSADLIHVLVEGYQNKNFSLTEAKRLKAQRRAQSKHTRQEHKKNK